MRLEELGGGGRGLGWGAGGPGRGLTPSRGLSPAVVVGADRVAANGDTANKVGTYGLALAARHHSIPFYVAAPGASCDPALPDGSRIPIEERPARELTHLQGLCLAPPGGCGDPRGGGGAL